MDAASLVRLIALGAIWGSSFAFMRVAVPAFGPVVLIGLRLALAAAFLLAAALVLQKPVRLSGRVGHYVIVSGVNSAVPFLCFAFAALTLSASLLAVFNSLAPVFGAMVAWLWFGTPITRETLVGLGLGVLGVGAIAAESVAGASVTASTGAIVMALIVLLAAPVCYGIAATYVKWRAADVTPFENALGAMLAASTMTAPLAAGFPPPGRPSPIDWISVGFLGVMCRVPPIC
jgi:drug/metabolite transporter (DMT)-like permease